MIRTASAVLAAMIFTLASPALGAEPSTSIGFNLDPLQLITLGGAAGAFFLIIKWMVDGKLHTDSEVAGLRDDKKDLLKVNSDQAVAMAKSNDLLEKAQELIGELRGDVTDRDKRIATLEAEVRMLRPSQ